MKKIISFLLVLLLCFSLIPTWALAETYSGSYSSGDSNGTITWSLDTETGVLTFSGTSGSSIIPDAAWHSYRDVITSVVIEEGITGIVDNAFEQLMSLTSVTIPSTVTSIGANAFFGCENIKSVYIYDLNAWRSISIPWIGGGPLTYGADLYLNGELVTEVVVTADMPVSKCVFWGCGSITSVVISEGVTNLDYAAFRDCKNLTKVTVPETLTKFHGAFSACNNIDSVYISDLDAWLNISDQTPLQYGADLYLDEVLVTEVVIPQNITSISYQFQGCTSLKSVVMYDNITSISDSAFSGCTSLESITIPESVTTIGSSAFSGCTSLESVVIPANVTSLSGGAFENCTALENVTIYAKPGWQPGRAFSGCTNIKSLTIPFQDISLGVLGLTDSKDIKLTLIGEGDMQDFASPDETPWYSLKNCVTSLVIDDRITSVGANAFAQFKVLKSVSLGNGVVSIGDEAFYRCVKLKEINIPENCSSVGYLAFQDCIGLKNVSIPQSVTFMDVAVFSGCANLKDIYCEICIGSEEFEGWEENWAFGNDATVHWTHTPGEAATCEKDQVCEKCGEVIVEKITGHLWDNGNVITLPNCDQDGLKQYICTVCGATKDEILTSTGHVYIDEGDSFKCICGDSYLKNGLVKDSDGETRYYVDGEAICAGLVCDDEGNYYYINSTLKAVKNCKYSIGVSKTNGLLPSGTYDFDVDGKIIINFTIKNGLVKDADGEIRYYVDGEAICAGLVCDDEGNYYYINSTLKAVRNCTYAIGSKKTNGLLPRGTYNFDADGKMIMDFTIKNGLVKDADGEIRYYVDGEAICAGLVCDDEGNYYYINSTLKAVRNCTYAIGPKKTNGLLSRGTYNFDADGKMIIE